MERTCATCGADISARPPRARWCEKCANARKAARDRARRARVGQQSVHGSAPQPSVVEPLGGPQNVPPDVQQLALRVSVIDAGDDDGSEVDFAGLVVDVLGLSLNRRNLLRALLEEVEP